MPLPRNAAGDIDLDAISHSQGLARPSVEFMDIPKAFGAGAGEGTQGIGEGMQATGRQLGHNAIAEPSIGGTGGLASSIGLNALGDLLSSAGKSVGDYFTEHMSEGGKAVNQIPLTEAVKNPLNIPQVTAKMFGQVTPVLVGSALAGPAGVTGLGFMQNQGMTHATASRQAQESINQLNDAQLMQSPTFVELFHNIDQSPQYKNFSDLQKIDLAKVQLAETAAMGALNNIPVLMANIASAYAGDAELGRLMTGDAMKRMEKSLPGKLTKHMGKNAGINAGVMSLQQWAINNELNNLGIGHRDVMQGVKDSAIEGAIGGSLMAVPPAVIGHVRQRVAKGKAGNPPEVGDAAGTETQKKVDAAVNDIQEGEELVRQGEDSLKTALQPESDLFGQDLGETSEGLSPWDKQGKGLGRQVREAVSSDAILEKKSVAAPTTPKDVWGRDVAVQPSESQSGLTKKQKAQQYELVKDFDSREKFVSSRPNEFTDIPAYARAGKQVQEDFAPGESPNASTLSLVDAEPEARALLEAIDNYRAYENGDLKTKETLDELEKDVRQAADTRIRMKAIKEGADQFTYVPAYERAGKTLQSDIDKISSHSRDATDKTSFRMKGGEDHAQKYKLPETPDHRSDENGREVISEEDFAAGREAVSEYEDDIRKRRTQPLIEDKNIIFADGEKQPEPSHDDAQQGVGPEFRAGRRVRGGLEGEYIPGDVGALEHKINTIDAEARRVYPEIEDKNIIFSPSPVPDEGPRGNPPQFERGKTKAQNRLDRFEERIAARRAGPGLPDQKLPSGNIIPPDAVSDVATSGNAEVYVRRNGKPFPSEGLARLSKPYSEAKKAGKKPEVVKVEGGYAVEVPPSIKEVKTVSPKLVEKPAPRPPGLKTEKAPTSILTHDGHEAFFDRLIEHPDQVTPEQVKSALESTIANKETILTALNKLTRDKLRPYQGYYFDSSTKKDRMVETAYEALLNQYRWLTNKGDVMVTSGRQSNEERARDAIANITQQDINEYAAGVQKNRKERRERIEAQRAATENPQTMDDFRLFIKTKGRDALSESQRSIYDHLLAEQQLANQKEKAEAPRVTSGFSHDDELKINPIEQGKNSKTGETIYNVNLETRLGTEKFKEAAGTARKLGGGYWRGNFWFPTEEKAQQFTSWLRGESMDHTADDAARREQKQERLTESAERLQGNAEDRLNADRKVNTVKRIREAAHAMARAENDLRDAGLLRKIADGKADGSVKYLAGLQHKTQLDTLRRISRRLVYDIPQDERDKLSYTTADGKREWKDEVPLSARVKYARYPLLDWHPSALLDVLEKMKETRGYKLAASELRLSQQREHGMSRLPAGRRVNDKLAAFISGQPGNWPEYVAEYNRMQRAGITTRPLLRAALTELETLTGEVPVPKVPRLEQMEMDLREKLARNRNAFNDFFPTPESEADYFAELADIQPGMDVLEPSAGNGVLADAARRAGANVDVVEIAPELRDILKEKGHNVVGSDFDEFTPDKQYDRILMNPPFSNDIDIRHVQKAWEHLKPGGRLTAIVSAMTGYRKNKRNQAFREWLDDIGVTEERLPEGMFKDSMNPTGVATQVLTLDKPGGINYSKVPRTRWTENFPDTVLHGRLGDATAHPDYEAAKAGDAAAARRLVADLMTRESVDQVRRMLDGRQAILAAVHAEEASGRNAIPQAMADVLGKILGLEVDPHLYQSVRVGRTAQDGFGRLTNQASFDGPVRTDLPYLLLDDTLTQGGTLANLRGYIEDRGGEVIGTSALTGKRYSARIALAAETLDKLRDHFEDTDLENWWQQQHGYGFDRLTESEANYLLRAADADKIRMRVLGARQDGATPAESEGIRDDGPVPPDVNHKFSKNASGSGGVFASGSPRERIRSGVADYQPRGVEKSKVEAEVARFLQKWKGAGGLTVQVAKDLAEAEKLAGFALPNIHAVHLPNSNRVILVADHLDSLSHVRAKLRHEILGHHALSEVVGPAEYEKILRTVAVGQNSKSLKPYFDRVLKNYDDADPWKQVEEVISHVLEDGERGILGRAWERVSGAVLQTLRKAGFLDEENITAAEVRNLMRPVARRLKRVGSPPVEMQRRKGDATASFSLLGEDGLLTRPRPGETETEATKRRATQFGKELDGRVSGIRKWTLPEILKKWGVKGKTGANAAGIYVMTNRQLAEVYNHLMTTDYAGKYQSLQAKMEARRNRIMNSAERGSESQWRSLGKAEGGKLSDLMHDATMTRIYPDKPLAEQDRFQTLKNEQTRLKPVAFGPGAEKELARYDVVTTDLDAMRENYKDLHQRWKELSPEARELWRDTEEWYSNSYSELKEALLQRISDVGGDQHAALISRVREQFERSLKDGPYFPLARFGKYVVVASKGTDYIREHFEDKNAALSALEAYRKDGYTANQSVKSKVNGTNQDSGYSVGKSILELIQKSGDEKLNKDALTDELWQKMLELMPDSSYARHFIRRRRVKGASHDGRRAFSNSAFHFAHHISKIEYGHKMQSVLDDMGNEIDAAMKGESAGVASENIELSQRVLDELKMRHEMTMNPAGDGFGSALTGVGYVYTMAFNPSSALINATQTALTALPQLGARYGWGNASKALGRATADYFRSADKRFKWFGKDSSWLDKDAWRSLSRSQHLSKDELDLMQRLNEDGVISITQASTLAQRSETGNQERFHNKLIEGGALIGGQLFHNVEVANREVTALAAYRLAKEAAGGHIDPEKAYQIASKAIYDAHFDYSSANRPRWMRKEWQKVVFQFKVFAQHMSYTLGRSFMRSFTGETPEVRRQARNEFMGYMLMHTLVAGVTGLPFAVQGFFGAAAQGIHAATSDDDAPWDSEVALRNWLNDEFGGFTSTAIMDGMVNALGVDLHSRVGLNDLFFRFAPEGMDTRDQYAYYGEQLAGPVIGSLGLNFVSGFSKIMDGDWLGGIKGVAPAAVKNLVKTYEEGMQGVTTGSGEEVVPADEFTALELASQAFGFTPSRIKQAYDARSAIKNAQGELSSERSDLLQRYFVNAMNGDDNSDVLEDIQAYNHSDPANAITGEVITQAIKRKQKARIRKERGVALSKKEEHLRRLGRFAEYDPVL